MAGLSQNSCDYNAYVFQHSLRIIAVKAVLFQIQPRYRRIARCLLLAFALSTASAYDFARLEQQFIARFGLGHANLLREWHKTIAGAQPVRETDKLRRINDFINQRIGFDDDSEIWGQSDYWATPLETIGQGRGDCEDFAIIKYFSLKNTGIPPAKLRLVYVKAKVSGPNGPYLQAHMVLAYYPNPNSEPLVLDNLVTDIKPASQRTDLQPVFSFNSEAIWNGVAESAARGGGTGQLSRWQDLLQRARAEGID